MKDKAIRNILIEYLKANNNRIRIYQEKSIGDSICDVMAVTNQLTGYEIKSDSDNYTRLSSQISAYDMFFDKNYIVVGKTHLHSAQSKVPLHWGIICVDNSGIEEIRPAQNNQRVNRERQLSILWKIELKNLLVKNNFPAFAQKEKGYIANHLVNNVDSKKLGKQITEELLNRDYSIFGAEDYTINYIGETPMPVVDIVDRLSEMDLGNEMTLDKWIAIYNKAKSVKEEKKTISQDIPNNPIETVEHNIPFEDIEVTLGVPWIPKYVVEKFINDLLGVSVVIDYESVTGNWFINDKRYWGSNFKCTHQYGLVRYNALFIIEATLNLREIKLFDGTEYNEQDTFLALEKQKLINKEFKKWASKGESIRWVIEDEYNKLFGKYTKTEFDGSKLEFPEMNDKYTLYPYQKDAVQKIISSKNTLLAFDVGAGKTYIMIAAAMKMRQDGISRKNMFVVPNNIVGQWEKIFSELYPKSKTLVVEPKTFKPEMRSKVLKQIKNGDYDGIIIAYSCFDMIPLSVDYVKDTMNEDLEKLTQACKDFSSFSFEKRMIAKQKSYVIKLANELISSMFDEKTQTDIVFDDLDINSIFLDEAHNYKNIPIKTKLKNLKGINTSGSKKCLQMQGKIRCIQEKNNGRGAIFATGTPLCNSISDTYAMQMYLQYDDLMENHLDVFDNWVKTFAQPELICEVDVDTSSFRFVKRFVRFFNLPELSKMISDFAVFHAVESENLPDFKGYTDIKIANNEPLRNYMHSLSERTDKIRAKEVDRKVDNMLKISTDGRKAALDLRLVKREQKYDKSSKIFNCVSNIKSIYDKYEGSSQLVFCDYSTPKGADRFDVYNELKDKLIKAGISEKEIAFIHSYKSESRKVKLFNDVNSGKIRVLIGSTFKLGIGANVQTKLKAIHHLDVPWRPADMVQREGRILRQGNENEEIKIFRYIAEGSFDAYAWQILENKQKFISQFLSGSTYQRSASDLENSVLTYAEVKALALATPIMKQLAEKENECNEYRILFMKENESRTKLKEELELTIKQKDKQIRRAAQTSKLRFRVKQVRATELKPFLDKLHLDFILEQDSNTILFKFSVFNFVTPALQDEKKPYLLLQSDNTYRLEIGSSPSGNARRITNFINTFDKIVAQEREKKLSLISKQSQIEEQLALPPKYEDLYNVSKQEVETLKNLIRIQNEKEEI